MPGDERENRVRVDCRIAGEVYARVKVAQQSARKQAEGHEGCPRACRVLQDQGEERSDPYTGAFRSGSDSGR